MPATARLMVLMSPEERAALDAKARALGVAAGEVVRRAVQAFELGTEEEAAELLLQRTPSGDIAHCRRMSPEGRRDFGAAIDARSDSPAPEGGDGPGFLDRFRGGIS